MTTMYDRGILKCILNDVIFNMPIDIKMLISEMLNAIDVLSCVVKNANIIIGTLVEPALVFTRDDQLMARLLACCSPHGVLIPLLTRWDWQHHRHVSSLGSAWFIRKWNFLHVSFHLEMSCVQWIQRSCTLFILPFHFFTQPLGLLYYHWHLILSYLCTSCSS